MNQIVQLLPELETEESLYIQNLTADLPEDELAQFVTVYKVQRKDTQTTMYLTAAGFISVAGIQRFYLDQVGMGILYLLTGGLCFVGTIIDLVNYKKMTFEYNSKKAQEILVTLHLSL